MLHLEVLDREEVEVEEFQPGILHLHIKDNRRLMVDEEYMKVEGLVRFVCGQTNQV